MANGSVEPEIPSNSIKAFRAAVLGVAFLVMHPVRYKSGSREEGMAAFALGHNDAVEGLKLGGVSVLLENTVGAGASPLRTGWKIWRLQLTGSSA